MERDGAVDEAEGEGRGEDAVGCVEEFLEGGVGASGGDVEAAFDETVDEFAEIVGDAVNNPEGDGAGGKDGVDVWEV